MICFSLWLTIFVVWCSVPCCSANFHKKLHFHHSVAIVAVVLFVVARAAIVALL